MEEKKRYEKSIEREKKERYEEIIKILGIDYGWSRSYLIDDFYKELLEDSIQATIDYINQNE